MSNYILADGFNDCIIGIDVQNERIVYDKQKMIDVLINDGMSDDEAVEFLEYNTWYACVSPNNPIYIDVMSNYEIMQYIKNNETL